MIILPFHGCLEILEFFLNIVFNHEILLITLCKAKGNDSLD